MTLRARRTAYRLSLCVVVLACAMFAHARQCRAAESDALRYPVKPIRLIAPFAPGGGASIVARLISPELTEAWGQPVVVDNRPGAGGAIGMEVAARAPSDGYTLVVATVSTVVINPLVRKVGFDPSKDFTPVVHTTTVPLLLVVHPAVPVNSVKDLIAYAKLGDPPVNYASSGEGTISHLAAELFKAMTHSAMTHVPYKGGGQAVIDLVAGHVQTGFVNILEALPQVKANRLRALAISTPKRSAVVPNVPTVAEAGVPGYEVVQWSGVLGPARMPNAITAKLNSEIGRILARSDIRQRLVESGAEAGGGTPEQFAALIRSDIAKWSKVVSTVRVKGGAQ